MALTKATRKRSRASSMPAVNATADAAAAAAVSCSMSDGEADNCNGGSAANAAAHASGLACHAAKRRRRHHSYAGADGTWLAHAAAADEAADTVAAAAIGPRASIAGRGSVIGRASISRGSIGRGSGATDSIEAPSLALRLAAAGVDVPDEFVCPLTRDIMRVPVLLTGDGRHYESAACARWLVTSHTSPVTGARLPGCNFMAAAHALRRRIDAFLEDHAKSLAAAEAAPSTSPTTLLHEAIMPLSSATPTVVVATFAPTTPCTAASTPLAPQSPLSAVPTLSDDDGGGGGAGTGRGGGIGGMNLGCVAVGTVC